MSESAKNRADCKAAIQSLYGLQEIAEWNETDSEVTVPSLQRGLVWKAKQMEMLWDSILRGFPIGSFVIASFPEIGEEESFHLLDGQQRMNAIKLGCQGMSVDGKNLPILWYDLAPKGNINSTRKHWIRVSTPAHPWGYKNDDECSTLSADQKREACKKFGAKDTFRPETSEAWPAEAGLPVPISILVRAGFDAIDATSFSSKVMELLGIEPLPQKWRDEFEEACKETLKEKGRELSIPFSSLQNYRVTTAYIPKIFELEMQSLGEERIQQVDEIECLFDRMNTLGTRISSEDLHYSIIKAHFPPELKKENERVAENIMPPAHLVMLAFRLALSPSCLDKTEKEVNLQAPLSLARIRAISRDKKNDREKICSLFLAIDGISPLGGIVTQLNTWMKYWKSADNGDPRLPPALLLEIILHSPEVYLLLMWLIREDKEAAVVTQKLCLQLATIIRWFADKKTDVCQAIVQECIRCGLSIDSVRRGLFFSIENNWLQPVFPDSVLKKEKGWHGWDVWANSPYWDWLKMVREQKGLLLYAQRHYLAEKFYSYDPANIGLFAENNRPWDMDHIIPQDWIGSKQGSEREFCKQWLNNIGNFAAIPFEINRSKSDSDDWNEYKGSKDKLLFDESFCEINNRVTFDKKMAQRFAESVRDRMAEIYASWHVGLGIDELLGFDEKCCPENIVARRKMFQKIKEALGEQAKCYFVQGGQEYPIAQYDDIHFCKKWLSVGVEIGKCLVCLTSDTLSYEIGVRKAPGFSDVDKKYMPEIMAKLADGNQGFSYLNNEWWYVVKVSKDIPEVTEVIEKLQAFECALAVR